MWPDVSKVIQNKKLDFLDICRLQQKQVIAGEFPIFYWGLKCFYLQKTFMDMICKSLSKCTPQAENFIKVRQKN